MPYDLPLFTGLPPNARLDLAFQTEVLLPDPGGGNIATYMVPGPYYDVLLSWSCEFRTSIQAGNRVVQLVARDAAGNITVGVGATSTIPTQKVYTLSWIAGVNVAYFDGGNRFVLPWPVTPSYPNTTIALQTFNQDAGDNFDQIVLTLLRIPSGPYPTTPEIQPVLSPVLV